MLDWNYFDPQLMVFARRNAGPDGKPLKETSPDVKTLDLPPQQAGAVKLPIDATVKVSVATSTNKGFFWNFGRHVDNLVEQIANHGDETEDVRDLPLVLPCRLTNLCC